MLKIICAGLPRTGTTSLAEALRILGYKTLHGPTDRLPLFPKIGGMTGTSWRAYDDVDAVVDLPAAMYWRELLTAYPNAKVILTVRDVNEWYKSMVRHIGVMRAAGDKECDRLHALVFGSAEPSEYWYKRRLREHESAVIDACDGRSETFGEVAWRHHSVCEIHHPLILNITDEVVKTEPWPKLCGFLDKPIPDVPFPWLNKGETKDG